MIKKVRVEQLVPGMFISNLDCDWLHHPFLANQFKIDSTREIEKIRALGLRHVFIDTKKGVDVAEGIVIDDIRHEINRRQTKIARDLKPLSSTHDIKDEWSNASQVLKETHLVIHNVLLEARMGRQFEIERITPVVDRMADSIFRNKDALLTICRIKKKDEYTFQHSVSVSVLLMAFARALDYSKDEIKQVGLGGMLHDVGKMRVPPEILNKPGKLTEAEFAVMKTHVALGCDLVEEIPGITALSKDVVAQHHERVDGAGYPFRLNEESMSRIGKMSSIVDVYDALTSTRVYKEAWEPSITLRKFLEWSQHHFDEELVHHFVQCVGIYPVGTFVHLSDDAYAVVVEQSGHNLLLPKVRLVCDAKRHKLTVQRDIDLSDTNSAYGLKIVEPISARTLNLNPIDFLH